MKDIINNEINEMLLAREDRHSVHQAYSNHFTRYRNDEAEITPTMLDPNLIENYEDFVYEKINEMVEDNFICSEVRREVPHYNFISPRDKR